MRTTIFHISWLIFFIGCQPATNAPEGVVRQWQEHMDKNQFEAAKKLSTSETQATITSIEALLSMDQTPIPIDTTEFITLTCKEKEDEAVCQYTIKLEGEFLEIDGSIVKVEEEIIADSFLLKKIAGAWLIDLPEEMMNDAEMEDMESIFNELLETED